MRWQMGRRSSNIEDRRGVGRGLAVGGGAVSLVFVVVALLLGVDPSQLTVDSELMPAQGGSGPVAQSAEEAQLRDFVSVVLASTEDTWNQELPEIGGNYVEPRLVLFSGAVDSACGFAQSAVGPFYCPGDQRVYLDLSFFEDLERLGAPGDFAQAYVIAHEVGHHVQTLLGTERRMRALSRGASQAEANALSVQLELQADCYAGVWASRAARENMLEPGDLEEGLQAAAAIGDDRLQRRAQGYVVLESFTHGTSAQRLASFKRGYEAGTPRVCHQ